MLSYFIITLIKIKSFFQIFRDRIYYGKKLSLAIQKARETLFMPHFVDHAVVNLDETLALGENLLFEPALDESVASQSKERMNQLVKRIGAINPAAQQMMKDLIQQIQSKKAIVQGYGKGKSKKTKKKNAKKAKTNQKP